VNPSDLGPYHLLATSSLSEAQTRVLKHGETFAVFDRYGDAAPGGLGEQGLFHENTRFLSCALVDLEGQRPFFLSSTVHEENDRLVAHLTNPDWLDGDRVRAPLGTLHLEVEKFLWRAACYQQIRIGHYGREPVTFTLRFRFGADYADIFEVRGQKRTARGRDLPAEGSEGQVILGYMGLDDVVRRTLLRFSPVPTSLTSGAACWEITLAPGDELLLAIEIGCQRHSIRPRLLEFSAARDEAAAEHGRSQAWLCRLTSVNGQFNAWFNRAVSDLHMLVTSLPTGPYPHAGLPWFNTPFGRDGLITALECLWLRPDLARGVLRYLAATQASALEPEKDAEPGKILHETRNGEMANLGEIPYGQYYGSVDATPLFVVLAGAYYERTLDLDSISVLWPNVLAALKWIDTYGDLDGDGLIEYERKSLHGLLHQGWKDSDDAICHADGTPAEGPIALCEVQGYVFAAWQAAARLAEALGYVRESNAFKAKAEALRGRFEELFWCDEIGSYALALDGEDRPCRVRSSNAAQCLFTGIADSARARRIAQTIFHPDFYSGWGIRTLAAGQVAFNPLSYHNGSVWPHDNALIASGLARYGETKAAARLLAGLFEAGQYFDLNRMPELFCGFPRHAGVGPIPYPVACSPQAWAAASVFLLIEASLGLKIEASSARVVFSRPALPSSLPELRIFNLEVGAGRVDLLLTKHDEDVSIRALRREGAHVHVLIDQ
jgi:glycogen debranching enzyme